MLNRRQFLSSALLGPAVARTTHAAPEPARGEWRNRQTGMSYRRLGRTDFQISAMVMGGNTITPENYDHVLQALDMGLNYLDTAPAYGRGRSEEGYARVLKSRPRDRFFLNTKVSLWDINRNRLYREIFDSLSSGEQTRLRRAAEDDIARRRADAPDYLGGYFENQRSEIEQEALANVMEKEYGRRIDRQKNYKKLILDSIDESLRRLGTDHLDLMMCPHGASSPHTLLAYPEVFDAFESLRKAGKVRHLGVSAHNDPAGILEAAVKAKVYSAAMVAYNIVNHSHVDRALEQAHNNGLGVIAMKVARPVFSGRANARPDDPQRVRLIQEAVPGPLKVPQKAYTWALRNPYLSAVISELVNRGMVDDNLPLAAPARS
jgi:aryl-alcohol dehydrogenase-like predicted oxidoreductase